MIDVVVSSVLAIVISVLAFDGIRLRLKLRKYDDDLVLREVEKMSLLAKIETDSMKIAELEATSSDGFLKFISESRDWAFAYIESLQLAIKSLSEAMNNGTEDDVTQAYNKVLEFMPVDDMDKA